MNTILEIKLPPMMEAIINFTNALYDQRCFDLLSKEEIRDILSQGQLISKIWLLENFLIIFKNNPELFQLKTVVVGGWVGLLARALNHLDPKITADSNDIDPDATLIASLTLDKIRGNAFTQDMYDIDYASYQCIVNTSAEHIENVSAWAKKVPKGSFLVVQSNNGRNIEGHISCVDSCEELEQMLNLSEVYYSGKLFFSNYTRFMVIGKT